MHPTQRSDLTVREVEGETLVFDRRSGKIHQLNRTASYIWGYCNGATSIADITKLFAAEFGVAGALVEQDVANAVAKFRELGLVTE